MMILSCSNTEKNIHTPQSSAIADKQQQMWKERWSCQSL